MEAGQDLALRAGDQAGRLATSHKGLRIHDVSPAKQRRPNERHVLVKEGPLHSPREKRRSCKRSKGALGLFECANDPHAVAPGSAVGL